MNLEDLQKAKALEGCINAANSNLKGYEILKEANEIKIEINDKGNEKEPIFIMGDNKNKMIDVLIDIEQEWLDDKLDKLRKL